MRLLIAEDELDLAEVLTVFLEKNQYTVDAVHDGTAALDYTGTGGDDAIILDIMMPGMDGLEVLTRLRDKGVFTPVMLLTARGEKDDRVAGFNAGADDYLPKPFAPDELLARVQAMLRRAGDYKPAVLCFGDLKLDCGSSSLQCGERTERLSGREFQVMELFMRSPRVILSAERIMERVWGWDTEAEINVVWVHISNLRKKLSAVGSAVSIRASRGLGYSLEVEVAPGLFCCGDAYAVRQLVSVLMDNAVKYADSGSIIRLSLEKEKKGVVLRTSNACAGLDARELDKLFDRFYRPAGPAPSRQGGLALACPLRGALRRRIAAPFGRSARRKGGFSLWRRCMSEGNEERKVKR